MSFKLPKQYQMAGLLNDEFVAKKGGAVHPHRHGEHTKRGRG